MSHYDSLTQARLHDLLDYDPDSGIFTWKPRDTGCPATDARFNSTYVGKPTGKVDRRRDTIFIRVDGRNYTAHKAAWFYVHGVMPDLVVHLNGDRMDNRIANLAPHTKREEPREVTQSLLHELLDYNRETGVFTWRARVALDRHTKRWNAKYAGGIAGVRTALGYSAVTIDGRHYLAHRLAWMYVHGTWPPDDIDHRDGNRDNNTAGNLRRATRGENHKNKEMSLRNTSGFTGVVWDTERGQWAAQIAVDRKNHHLGRFKSFRDAVHARIEAEYRFGFSDWHRDWQDDGTPGLKWRRISPEALERMQT